jgi:hypothetical protein
VTRFHQYSIEDIVAAGKTHGAQQADLYGCLYFYLSDQLQSFANRLKKFHISFHAFDRDALALAKDLRSGALGLPATTHFDRIDVSNIFDSQYVGIYSVLTNWAPLLSKTNRFATLLGCFMKWSSLQPGGEPGHEELARIMGQLCEIKKVRTNITSRCAIFNN